MPFAMTGHGSTDEGIVTAQDNGMARVPLLPGFILAFLALVGANSLISLPAVLAANALIASKTLLLLAVTATAMRTRTDLLLQLGWRSVMPVLAATIASLGVALGFAWWMI